MNEFAIEHIPESKYCFAEDKNTVTLRLRVSKYDRIVTASLSCKSSGRG